MSLQHWLHTAEWNISFIAFSAFSLVNDNKTKVPAFKLFSASDMFRHLAQKIQADAGTQRARCLFLSSC